MFMSLIVSRCNCSDVGSVVKWLELYAHDQRDIGSKPIRAILLCPSENTLRHFPLLGGLGKQF